MINIESAFTSFSINKRKLGKNFYYRSKRSHCGGGLYNPEDSFQLVLQVN